MTIEPDRDQPIPQGAQTAGTTTTVEGRFASLEDASRRLSGDVQALNATLVVVSELTERQADQDQRTAAAEAEIEQAKIDTIEHDARIRNVIIWVTGGLITLVSMVAVLLFWSLLVHVNNLLDQAKDQRIAQCMQRNEGTVSAIERESQLARLETDPALKKLHADSAQKLRESKVDCKGR